MARMLRSSLPDGFFHVTARGVDGAPTYRDERDYLGFLELLLAAVKRSAWECHAFCLMPNHYHLVVDARRDDVSSGLHRLNGVYAQRFNRRHDRRGHLWGDRFAAHVVESEEHLANACAYVYANPERAGLAARRTDWPWRGVRGLDEHTFAR